VIGLPHRDIVHRPGLIILRVAFAVIVGVAVGWLVSVAFGDYAPDPRDGGRDDLRGTAVCVSFGAAFAITLLTLIRLAERKQERERLPRARVR
jgi:hypothetical protein